MAVPKRRTSSGRRDRRRAHDRLTPTAICRCPQCGNAKQAHTVCKTCGFYRKREVIEILD
jgi:large subunit ribosomal protein L32